MVVEAEYSTGRVEHCSLEMEGGGENPHHAGQANSLVNIYAFDAGRRFMGAHASQVKVTILSLIKTKAGFAQSPLLAAHSMSACTQFHEAPAREAQAWPKVRAKTRVTAGTL